MLRNEDRRQQRGHTGEHQNEDEDVEAAHAAAGIGHNDVETHWFCPVHPVYYRT